MATFNLSINGAIHITLIQTIFGSDQFQYSVTAVEKNVTQNSNSKYNC